MLTTVATEIWLLSSGSPLFSTEAPQASPPFPSASFSSSLSRSVPSSHPSPPQLLTNACMSVLIWCSNKHRAKGLVWIFLKWGCFTYSRWQSARTQEKQTGVAAQVRSNVQLWTGDFSHLKKIYKYQFKCIIFCTASPCHQTALSDGELRPLHLSIHNRHLVDILQVYFWLFTSL